VIKAEPRPLMIKPEPLEDRVLGRKRSGTLSVFQGIVPKKVKAELENPPLAEVDLRPSPSTSAEAIRGELLDLQTNISRLQPQLERSKWKSAKTTSQLKREMNITSELIALHQRRKELTEMLPAVSAPAHPIPGPSFQNGTVDGFIQPTQPLALAPPFVPAATVVPGIDLFARSLKDEPMDIDSGDNATLPPASDVDPPLPFGGDDNSQMLVDGTSLGAEFYHYNIAKADE
jgi:hypothetical protein